ncbi:Phenylpyruvate decarboxylase [Maudiozyma exigua]|uniref:Phenylpyruvate decarboxylase n=1 Tax=Maudiozyma exigua TaxID=34358 RepID=A0A9P6W820_MAUEX|nr:Phenylpyruvate decarboxylase [Kazachstania exigua]
MTPVTYDNESTGKFNFINLNTGEKEIPFGEYLFQRILDCGTKSVFGVPGDFNLPLLEYLYEPQLLEQGLRWIGNCNELNAAYAADGYSRYSNKIGCLITTYGVGELSAMNGIAGAFAENTKVLHIVGVARSTDSRCKDFKNRNLHHLVPQLKDSNFLGPNHKIYYEMVKDKICCSAEYLEDIHDACNQVDKVITDIYKYSKPGYIFVPADFVNMTVPTTNLLKKPTFTMENCIVSNNEQDIINITNTILDMLYQSNTPAIIGDVLTDRYSGKELINRLINETHIWNFASVNGKSIIDETNQTYMGLYNGEEGPTAVKERFLQCDLILNFGVDINEINQGHYSFSYKPGCKLIELHPTYIRFSTPDNGKEQIFKGINFIHILKSIVESIDVGQLTYQYPISVKPFCTEELNFKHDSNSEIITQTLIQNKFIDYLNPGDVVVCETGSVQFAMRDLVLPNQVKYISQGFFLSIGMALPAALGVGIAMQDFPRSHISNNCESAISESYTPRLILLEGDGAAQMTIQELTSMIRFNVPIEIMLWNNNGYTIERAILGPTRTYNDVMQWDWTKLLEAFGDFGKKETKSCTLETPIQLIEKMAQLKNGQKDKMIELIEVKLQTLDYPKQLRHMVESAKVKSAGLFNK